MLLPAPQQTSAACPRMLARSARPAEPSPSGMGPQQHAQRRQRLRRRQGQAHPPAPADRDEPRQQPRHAAAPSSVQPPQAPCPPRDGLGMSSETASLRGQRHGPLHSPGGRTRCAAFVRQRPESSPGLLPASSCSLLRRLSRLSCHAGQHAVVQAQQEHRLHASSARSVAQRARVHHFARRRAAADLSEDGGKPALQPRWRCA